ncbi:MAG: HPr family phosphocarrier protein [Lentisphaerae bacterium]|nr:HPr family phosphocarrier protein [Lentisphaerota bacterium]
MQERVVTVRNSAGIHCRPSGVILTAIKNEFPDHCIQLLTADGETVEVDSMLALISLALTKGTSVTLQIEGIDEERAIKRIGDLFEFEFDFPPRK